MNPIHRFNKNHNKEKFKILLQNMNYKVIERNNEVFFSYIPKKNLKVINKKFTKESPFGVLKDLNLN